jgi:antitoxin (DNA-binding transcriptional repressor) of toxin-antitoxin stability system
MALGSVALVADTIGLVPLAESAVRALARGDESVLTTQARTRVALVPASTLLGQTSPGWAAAWNTLPSVLASRYSAFLVLSLLLGVGAVVLVLRHRHVRVGRRRALFAAVVGYGLLMLGLGLSVRQAAKHSTAVRLRMARRLIEIAATASDVRQARLAEIAVSLDVRGLEPPVISTDTVVRSVSGGKPVARVTAATPRTRGGLEIGMTPIEAGLGRLYVALLLWFGLGAAGLIGGASAAGLSASGGLFHSTGPDAERTPQEGRTPE